MPTCFVIQPFDRGPFDKRFEDVLEPAIVAAGLEAYRVDRDPVASIPIDQIEAGIRTAEICLAEISTDNPNVWFELGYAIAAGKEVVLISSEDRPRFPFDIQHRNIIVHKTDSPRDFEELKDRITKRIQALLSKAAKLGAARVKSPVALVEGLSPHETVALVSVAENSQAPGDSVSTWTIRKDMESAGFTRIAVTLALTMLLRKSFLKAQEAFDRDGDPFVVYSVTDSGMEWLLANQDRLALTVEPRPDKDDVPF